MDDEPPDTTADAREQPPAPDLAETASIELVLEELRRRYDDVEERRSAIDEKATRLLTLNAVLISILGTLTSVRDPVTIGAVGLLLISGGIALLSIRTREYARPLATVGHVYAYSNDSKDDFRASFAELYESAITNNEARNEIKNRYFQVGFYTSAGAILLVGVAIIVRALS